jgi:hypothetical protein
MKASFGWNTAYGREKFDVIVEEEDVKNILTEHDLDVALADTMSATAKFRLLYLEAQVFSHTVLVQRLERLSQLGERDEEDQKRHLIAVADRDSCVAARASLLDQLRSGKVR